MENLQESPVQDKDEADIVKGHPVVGRPIRISRRQGRREAHTSRQPEQRNQSYIKPACIPFISIFTIKSGCIIPSTRLELTSTLTLQKELEATVCSIEERTCQRPLEQHC